MSEGLHRRSSKDWTDLMLRPNKTAWVERQQAHNLYGEMVYGKPFAVSCAIVRLQGISGKTSVRADSSASRGSIDEATTKAKILFAKDIQILVNDKITIEGFVMLVKSVQPRFNVYGDLDHYEVELDHWS